MRSTALAFPITSHMKEQMKQMRARFPAQQFLAVVAATTLFPFMLMGQEWKFVAGAMYGIASNNSGIILSVGQHGICFRSSDNGNTWNVPGSGGYATLYDAAFAGPAIAVAVGEQGTILRSDDAGLTWTRIETGLDSTLYRVSFPDPDHGFAAGNRLLLATDDGGRTWNRLPDLPADMNGMSFLDERIGIIAAQGGELWRTADGGSAWENVYTDTSQFLINVAFDPNRKQGYVCGGPGVVLQTPDSGQTWALLSGLHNRLWNQSIAVTPSGHLVVVGREDFESHIALAVSADNGETWQNKEHRFEVNTISAFQDVVFNDQGKGVAVSNVGSIVRTDDNWQTLERVTNPIAEAPLTGIAKFSSPSFPTMELGIVMNNLSGGYNRSTDGGITWLAHNFGGMLNGSVQLFSEAEGLLVGDDVTPVWKTMDGGLTWKSIGAKATPSRKASRTMLFIDRRHGFQVGDLFYATTDSGLTWTGKEIAGWTGSMGQLSFTSPQTGWIAGEEYSENSDSAQLGYGYGRIAATTDGGETWRIIYAQYGLNSFPTFIELKNEQEGYTCVGGDAYGHPGKYVLLATSDGGENWKIREVFDEQIIDLAFFTDSLWYMVGSNASIWVSADAGRSWTQETISPLPTDSFGFTKWFWRVLLLPDKQTAMIFGRGAILRREFPEPLLSVSEEMKERRNIRGRLSIIPSPASDRITLHVRDIDSYQQPNRVEIFNALGERIFTEEISFDKGGTASLDISALSSGSYRVLIKSGQGNPIAEHPLLIVR